ncbi:MAG: LamG domain-containing protein, partial [Planctomycetales bacterium]|nr:LamG domain-containing protein [Planctomycetales bacterium]
TPLHFWTSADPNDPDSDDDGLTDRQEQVYGYNPHAPSELDVLALDTSWTSEHPQYNPYLRATSVAGYGYFDYAATVTNDLNNKYLRGLLETEFPVDSIISTREVGTLLPQASSTLTGTVALEDIGITASTATSLTLRAGAIVDKPDDHLFWLRMNQPAGTDVDTFADSTVYDYDIYAGNMTATGQFAYFPVFNSSLNISLTSALRATLDEAEGLTFALWFKLTESNNGWNTFLLTGSYTGNLLWVNTDGYLRARDNLTSSTLVTADEWHHAAVTFDGATSRLYLDGQLEASGGDGKTSFSSDIALGAGYHPINTTYAPFYMDDLEVFTSAL